MKYTSALILEASDFTKDGNLKKEAFDAFAKFDLVIRDGLVVKTGASLVTQALQQDKPKRVRKPKAEPATMDDCPPPNPS